MNTNSHATDTRGKNIAIIGTGIAGLTCAYYLSPYNRVTLFEKNDYIGGHTHTVDAKTSDEEARIDTGFIVFNDRTYPMFMELLGEIDVAYQPTEMSFSVRNDAANLEYSGASFLSLFAQPANLVKPGYYLFLRDIMRFNRDVRKEADRDPDVTIGQYLDRTSYSRFFHNNYLLPMIAAIWSMGVEQARDFPLSFFVRFFENHGLLDVTHRPQWYTVKGGSSSYIEPLTKRFAEDIRLASPVMQVLRTESQVEVTTDIASEPFDEVIFACHGDEILPVLANPTSDEDLVLGRFSTSRNRVILHTDSGLLPKRPAAWASWNYRVDDELKQETALTYHMNILQRLEKKHNYLVSLNQEVDESKILSEFVYNHPVYSTESLKSQEQWNLISGKDRLHFCGAYWFNGFHEDGVRSGRRVCGMIRTAGERI